MISSGGGVDWLHRRLSKYGDEPSLAQKRHDEFTARSGRYIASGGMRMFRASCIHAGQSCGVFRRTARSATSLKIRRCVKTSPSGDNDPRQTYRTNGQIAGISEMDRHLFMDYSPPGVNVGYITRCKSLDIHLRR